MDLPAEIIYYLFEYIIEDAHILALVCKQFNHIIKRLLGRYLDKFIVYVNSGQYDNNIDIVLAMLYKYTCMRDKIGDFYIHAIALADRSIAIDTCYNRKFKPILDKYPQYYDVVKTISITYKRKLIYLGDTTNNIYAYVKRKKSGQYKYICGSIEEYPEEFIELIAEVYSIY